MKLNNRDACRALYDHVNEFDKKLSHRYDRMTGSNYIYIIANQLGGGVISENDLKELSEGVVNGIRILAGIEK